MSDNIKVTISAEDRASREFAKVADGAERMGRDIEDAGKRSSRSLQDLERDARSVGLGLAAMIGTLSVAGASFRDQEIALNTLRRSYGEAADGLIEFTEALADNSNYSEEAITNAANVAATLSRNYGATAAEIQQILQISADLAATSGFAFEDATQRVVAALRGEAEAAEQLGLTMNQQAIDRNNLTLSMSNQEAFQFRLNALTEQSAFAMGAAAEQADTAYGSMVNLEGSIRDTGQSIAEALGPLGEIGAYAANNAIQVGLFSIAMGQMGRAALSARTAILALGAAHSSVALLGAAMGPVGLVAAAGLAVVGVGKLVDMLTTTYEEATESAVEGTNELSEALAALGQTETTAFGYTIANEYRTAMMASQEYDATLASMRAERDLYIQQQQQMIPNATENRLAIEAEIAAFEEQAGSIRLSKDELELYGEAQSALADVLGETTQAAELQIASIADMWESYKAGNITLEEFSNGVLLIAGMTEEFTAQALRNNDIMGDALALHSDLVVLYEAEERAVGGLGRGYGDLAMTAADYLAIAADIRAGTRNDIADREREIGVIAELKSQYEDLRAMQSGGGRGAGLASEFHGLGAAMATTLPTAEELAQQISEATDEYLRLRDGIATTGEALDNGFRVIVSNTNAIASQAQSVADWADELIGVKGEYALIDDLLSDGIITLEQYNAAQEAQISIAQDAALIQSYVNEIQAEQAPILAELMSAQENYIEQIANMEGRQQLAALGFMDTAMAAQAMELQMYALSGASDEAITSVIAGAAAADPVLASMLEQMGLISIGADGTITVNVEGQSALDELSESIDRLTLVTYMITMGVDAETARQTLIELLGLADDWGSSSPTASLNVMDNATGPISRAMDMLALFNGTTVTAYANVVQVGGVDRIGNGGVAGYANGGMVAARMGEWGTETLHFPNGGVAHTRGDGIYAVPQGTYVTPHTGNERTGSTTVHVNIANLYGDETLAERVSAQIVPAIQRAMAQHVRGF